MPLAKRFDQFDLAGQMFGIERCNAMQFLEQLRRDQLRRGVLHAVHDAMTDRFHRIEIGLCLDPFDQKLRSGFVILSIERKGLFLILVRRKKGNIRPARSDAIDLPVKPSLQRSVDSIERKLDAR